MGKFLTFIVSFILVSIVYGQEITVYDKVTQERIPGAKIYSLNPNIQIVANKDGRFQLDIFKECDSVYVSYPSYELSAFSILDLKVNYSIELSDKLLSISEMTVSTNRWEEDQINSATKVVSLDMKEARLLGPQTSADLLESSGYVYVQKSQLAGGSPRLRGFGTNRIMIVVDGVRMNNAIFRSGNLQNIISVDGNSLESVEVLFGTGSVMYGSDAIGGVMNFTQKKARYSPDSTKALIKSNVFSRYSSSSNEITGHIDLNIGLQKWGFLSSISYSLFDDLVAGEYGPSSFLRPSYQNVINGKDTTLVNPNSRKQLNSGYNQLNLYQQIAFRPNEYWCLKYGVSYSTSSNAPRYDRLILDKDKNGVLDNAEWYYGPQQWVMHNLSVEHISIRQRAYNHLRLTIAFQNFKESRHDRKFGEDLKRNQHEKLNAFSLNLDLKKQLGKNLNLFYGMEGILNIVGSNANQTSISTGNSIKINSRYPDASTWQTYGIYTDLKYNFSPKWSLNIGVRFSVYQIEADFDTSLFALPFTSTEISNNALNGGAGLVFKPSSHLQFYTNLSSGFRAPNIDDLGKVFDSEPGNVVIPNIDLKPEYAYSGELGFVKAFGNKAKFDGALFATYLDNALVRSSYKLDGEDSIFYQGVKSQVLAIQNTGNAYVYGVQGGVEFVFGRGFSVHSQINYQKGYEFVVDSLNYFPMSHVTPLFGRTTFSYKRKKFRIILYALYNGQMKHSDLPLNERNEHIYTNNNDGNAYSPSWYTLNLKAAYFINKHLSVTLGVENLTNQLYRTFGSGISASGRNYSLTLKGSF